MSGTIIGAMPPSAFFKMRQNRINAANRELERNNPLNRLREVISEGIKNGTIGTMTPNDLVAAGGGCGDPNCENCGGDGSKLMPGSSTAKH